MTLNEIVERHYKIDLALMENGGELTPEIESMLDENNINFDDKLDGYARFINHLKTQSAGLKSRVAELNARKKSLDNTILNLRDRMIFAMKERNIASTKTAEFTFSYSVKKGYEVVEDSIPDDLTPELIDSGMLEFVKKFDKTAIKKKYAESDFVVATEKDSITIRG